MKLLKSASSSKILRESVARVLPLDLLKASLFHELPRLRLAAFQSIGPILGTYDNLATDPIHCLEVEIDLWRESLPYSFKCSEKEYVVTLTQTLRSFLGRISDAEAACDDCNDPLLLKFVNDFLLKDVFVRQAAYPGTVAEKEKWAILMLDCIVSFASQNHSPKQKKTNKRTQLRRVLPIQEQWFKNIMTNVLSEDVLATLISLMHSMWDSTRSSAYETVLDVLQYAKVEEMNLPRILSDRKSFGLFQARAIHLASSPRQREADTGARMLSVLCATMT